MRPMMVAAGAAGPARTLATTPNTGIDGASRMSTGWQASWAANGIASAAAIGVGSALDSTRVSGPDSRSSPPVANTDSVNP